MSNLFFDNSLATLSSYFSHGPEQRYRQLIRHSTPDLTLDSLEYGLNYELNITKGKIDFLELATNGEDWDGNYENFEFSNS